MKKRILLPTDFSKNAWNAILYATELYKNEKCDFYLLNAFTEKAYDIDGLITAKPGDKDYDLAEAHSKKEMIKTLKRLELRNVYPNHTYFTLSVFGTPLDVIKKTIELKDIDLVVIGTKGATDDTSIYYGSNAVDVMEESRNCPVLAVPSGYSYIEPKEIVFPTSFKTHYKRRELNYLYEISKFTNAKIRILHVNKEDHLSTLQNQNKDLRLIFNSNNSSQNVNILNPPRPKGLRACRALADPKILTIPTMLNA